jgi:prepilin-type N-terminal cleavage/methylation domain-containing protein/prepilin-type processing-associated H-X9-DG protein
MAGQSRGGFTLIEVLVVITILAILSAFLFPVFSRVQAKGRSAVCQSNLRQFAAATLMYIQDYDGNLPPGKYSIPDPIGNRLLSWGDLLRPYMKHGNYWQCPDFVFVPPLPGVVPGPSTFNGGIAGYAYNYWLEELSETAISYPASTIIFFDSLTYHIGGPDNTTGLSSPGSYRHLGGANYTFVDGHVKWYRVEQLRQAYEGPSNGSPGWRP